MSYTALSLGFALVAYGIVRFLVFVRSYRTSQTLAECDTYAIWRDYQVWVIRVCVCVFVFAFAGGRGGGG